MEEKIIVPPEFASQAQTAVELLREAARAQGVSADDLYLLSSQSSKGFEPVTMSAAVLLIGSTSATWLTKHWVDSYLWPFIQSRVDKPSREFLDWLGTKLPGQPTPIPEPRK
jgi:hypothetical protein